MTHVHWTGSSTDCDGTYLFEGTHGYPDDTVGEVLAQVVADQYHECDLLHGGQALGRYCDEYEHARTVDIRPDGTVAVHDGVPYVQGWMIETSAPTEEGGRGDEYHVHDLATCDDPDFTRRRDLTAEAAGY